MQCQHGIKFRHSPSSNVRKCKTKHSLHSTDLCQFRINTSLCKETNSWYLHCRKGQRKNNADLHQYHLLMESSHIHSHISLFSGKELKLSSECRHIHINNTRTISLINIRNILGIQKQ